MEALLTYGKDWERVMAFVGSRDLEAVQAHAQKFFFKLVRYLEGEEGSPDINTKE